MELYYHNNHNTGPMTSLKVTLMRCGRIQYDCHLITALVEKWRSKTHSFHFRVGEATITLQDIQIIWGLPIDGEPVSGTDLERTSVQWQEYCMQYIGFAPEEGALKGSRLQVKAIRSHISRVHITPDTPHLTVVQYARAVALLLLGGTMCPDSLGNLRKRQSCNRWRVAVGTVRITVQVIRDILDEMQYDQFIWQLYDMESNVIMAYAGFQPPAVEINMSLDILCNSGDASSRTVDVEGYRQLVAQLEHEVQIIAEAIKHQPQQTATPSDSAPTTSHRQRRSSSQMSIGSVERGDIEVDIAGPSTAYTPQNYYVPQSPQVYYVPQPSQDNWFQSTSYMPSHAEAYSSHVDLDLGLGINQPYAPEYNMKTSSISII
ncbi:UNVERIFIED_CONTAM: Serine/threonine-protein phosphatase 7 long form [Sesamum angustifolium]|uniref:Serine/threonine-protein phosphatase 7 long form n=1 Tax=Sesamum angustifolium TaxID=2727405 RepID=A0AAW2KXK2_9LAMI